MVLVKEKMLLPSNTLFKKELADVVGDVTWQDLGIHTEMSSDGILPLVRNGNINNARKVRIHTIRTAPTHARPLEHGRDQTTFGHSHEEKTRVLASVSVPEMMRY
jgi:hypothetical protein